MEKVDAINEMQPTLKLAVAAKPGQDGLNGLALKDLLDPSFSEAYDRLTRLATKLLDVPVALVSISNANRQFFKSFAGLGEPWATKREAPLSHNYCQHVTATGQILKINNALDDDRLRDDPVTVELGVVAYLGVPLTISNGQTLGSFCAIHTQPHQWSESDIAVMADLAQSVITEIQLRAALKQAELAKQQSEDANRRVTAILEQVLDDAPGRYRR